jgi:hypothetical protein
MAMKQHVNTVGIEGFILLELYEWSEEACDRIPSRA